MCPHAALRVLHRLPSYQIHIVDSLKAPPKSRQPAPLGARPAGAMGKKDIASPRGRAFALGTRRVTRARLLAFLGVGFGLGLALGYIFMGTMHAVRPAGWERQAGLCIAAARPRVPVCKADPRPHACVPALPDADPLVLCSSLRSAPSSITAARQRTAPAATTAVAARCLLRRAAAALAGPPRATPCTLHTPATARRTPTTRCGSVGCLKLWAADGGSWQHAMCVGGGGGGSGSSCWGAQACAAGGGSPAPQCSSRRGTVATAAAGFSHNMPRWFLSCRTW